ncbi:hypothetical protein [Novilysobacter arseniciresistens]|uniref:hypothetical protein n=1 Tax=Novilysobacter arseniciresistens TaxID=1385522 RepID=UPI00136470CC|nr:hypothetical protein [Lysobacter arseniciresistens]
MMFCPCCESEDVTVARVSINAREVGFPSGRLSGVEEIQCGECGETTINIPAHGMVAKAYRGKLARIERPLSPEEFAYLRRTLGMSGVEYADAIRVSNVTISRVENGCEVPSTQESLIRALTLLDMQSRSGVASFVERHDGEVDLDVSRVAPKARGELRTDWLDIPPTRSLGANVVRFRRPTVANQPVDAVEFETTQRDDFGLRSHVAQC